MTREAKEGRQLIHQERASITEQGQKKEVGHMKAELARDLEIYKTPL